MLDWLVIDGGTFTEWLIRRYELEAACAWPGNFEVTTFRLSMNREAFELGLRAHPARLCVSAYSMAELQRLERDAEQCFRRVPREMSSFRSAFWASVQGAFELFCFNERHVVWTQLDRDLVEEYGPADASVIAVAQDLIATGTVRARILSGDADLRNRCRTLVPPVSAIDPWEFIAEHQL